MSEATSRGDDVVALLTARADAGDFRVDDAVARLVVVRLLIEIAVAGVELPRTVMRLVGEVCGDLGVTDVDPRPALDAALQRRVPGLLRTSLAELLRAPLDAGTVDRLAAVIGGPQRKPRSGHPASRRRPRGALGAAHVLQAQAVAAPLEEGAV
jgi:hypothetical protein